MTLSSGLGWLLGWPSRWRRGRIAGDVAEPLPYALRPLPAVAAEREGRTLHVLVPYLPLAGIFGGVATALRLAVELAHQGEQVHVVETERTDDLSAAQVRDMLQKSLGVPVDWLSNLTVSAAVRPEQHFDVGPDDVFVATAWWTAHRAHWTADRLALREPRFVYLVQDDEPSFYGGSDTQALAAWTYRMPCLRW